VRKDSPIRTAADLNGKIVASPALRDLFATTAAAWVDQNGGDSKTLHQIELAPAATQSAFESGRIDAASVSEPRASQLLNAGIVRVLAKPYDLIGKSFLNSAFFAMRAAVDANRDTYVRLAHAHHDANVFANDHQDRTAPWLAEIAQVPLADILRGTRAVFATKLDLAQIQPVIDAAARFKVIEHTFDASELVSPTALGI
jgi:NitT/TauT family transport system substrate-binding protein